MPQRGYAPEAVEAASEAGDRLGAQIVQQEGFFGLRGAVGTPDQIRDYLERYEEAGVDQVIFCSQSGKNRHEDIMESLELFGSDVLPAFIDRDEQLQKEKARAARAGHRSRDGAQARVRSPAARRRRVRVPGDAAHADRSSRTGRAHSPERSKARQGRQYPELHVRSSLGARGRAGEARVAVVGDLCLRRPGGRA